MSDLDLVKLHWKEKLLFHASQVKHCSNIGDFTYFHVHHDDYLVHGIDELATLKAQDVGDSVLEQLTNLNIVSTQANDIATIELDKDIKRLDIPPDRALWTENLRLINDKAKLYVVATIDANIEPAIQIIEGLPEKDQEAAADFFIRVMDTVMDAFDHMVTKDNGLYSAIPEFIRKEWRAVNDVVDSVTAKVSSCVTRLRALSTYPETDAGYALSESDAAGK